MDAKEQVSVLTKTQKRKSIGEQAKRDKIASASKTPRPKIRTTVVNPIELQWPLIPTEKQDELRNVLAEDFAVIKGVKIVPSLRAIREIPKKERGAFRKNLKQQEAEKLGFDLERHAVIRKSMALGVNSVSRELQKNSLSILLVEPEVNPPIITKLLVPMAENRNCQVVALPGVADVIYKAAGFKCIALGFKCDCQQPTHPLFSLYQKLLAVSTFVTKSVESKAESETSTPVSRYKHTKIRRLQS